MFRLPTALSRVSPKPSDFVQKRFSSGHAEGIEGEKKIYDELMNVKAPWIAAGSIVAVVYTVYAVLTEHEHERVYRMPFNSVRTKAFWWGDGDTSYFNYLFPKHPKTGAENYVPPAYVKAHPEEYKKIVDKDSHGHH
eukprot:TRINITY_DN210_c0_g1_i1.p1 TRINITY_DN210_c0_g1~~TRINITY_DN210_c0_g1_i1.p1  ORF type:complete len:137 (-),score=27.21 TRINITY_DN210_c0_g1_i1:164-574(-)